MFDFEIFICFDAKFPVRRCSIRIAVHQQKCGVEIPLNLIFADQAPSFRSRLFLISICQMVILAGPETDGIYLSETAALRI